jgi:hypothetical protein
MEPGIFSIFLKNCHFVGQNSEPISGFAGQSVAALNGNLLAPKSGLKPPNRVTELSPRMALIADRHHKRSRK